MEIKKILIIVLILFTCKVYSKKVDRDVVKQVALNAYKLKKSELNKSELKVEKLLPYFEGNDTLFYIANIDNSFIIISAENSTTPVLGYSFNNKFNISKTPPALKYLLNCYKREIIEIRKQNLRADKKNEEEWNSLLDGVQLKSATITTSAVSHLLTTTWGQGSDY